MRKGRQGRSAHIRLLKQPARRTHLMQEGVGVRDHVVALLEKVAATEARCMQHPLLMLESAACRAIS